MSYVSSERVQFALQAYLLYVQSLMKNKRVKARLYEKQRAETIQLMENLVVKSIEVESALEALNQLIFEVNQATLKEDFVPYPTIALKYPVTGIKEEILAFQHFLKEKIGTRVLKLETAEILFREATTIWLKVGSFLGAEQAVRNFQQLIEKTNTYLSDDEKYPIPSDSSEEARRE